MFSSTTIGPKADILRPAATDFARRALVDQSRTSHSYRGALSGDKLKQQRSARLGIVDEASLLDAEKPEKAVRVKQYFDTLEGRLTKEGL